MLAIVMVCYNRPDGMKMVFESIRKARYDNDQLNLIISIDKSTCQQELIDLANTFDWPYGEKKIRAFDERQGLRPHILQCGDLANEYDAIIVLEDDITVAEGFYNYVKQAMSFYQTDDQIAGISLYKHLINPGCLRSFEPVNNGYDVFLMQFAQSWGQCWTRTMWQKFRAWYASQSEQVHSDGIIPDYVANWKSSSWLKYFMKYIAETNRFFIYPYVSLATNHSDVGEHCSVENNDYHVPMLEGTIQYRFPHTNDAIKYDAFFERVFTWNQLFPGILGEKLLDLYGSRTNYLNADILISTRLLPYHVINSFQLKYRPHEVNCTMPVDGKDIFTYDLHIASSKPRSNKGALARYDIKSLHWKETLLHGFHGFWDALVSRIKR